MPSAADKFADELYSHQLDLSKWEAQQRKDARSLLEDLEQELVAKIAKGDPTSQVRLKALLETTQASIASTYKEAKAKNEKSMKQAASLQGVVATKALGAAISVPVASVGMTTEQLAALVKKPIVMGAPAAAWWDTQEIKLQGDFSRAMQLGYAAGETIDQMISRVRGTKAGGFSDGVMAVPKAQAEALVRTSINSISNHARLAAFEKMADAADTLVFSATFDGRTSNICKSLNGLAWNIKTKEPIGHDKTFLTPPVHFNCRSVLTLVPKAWADMEEQHSDLFKGKTFGEAFDAALAKQGFTPEQIAKARINQRATMDGQAPEKTTLDEWLRKKPPEFLAKSFGAKQADLWLKGKISLQDLTDKFSRPRSIADLEAIAGKSKKQQAKEKQAKAVAVAAQQAAVIAEAKQSDPALAAAIDSLEDIVPPAALLAAATKQAQAVAAVAATKQAKIEEEKASKQTGSDGLPKFSDLTFQKSLGGSTGAELWADAKGRKWVLKRGSSQGHLSAEVEADAYYRSAGIAVPDSGLIDTPTGPVKAAAFIEGKSLAKLQGAEREEAFRDLRRGFAADAILGNTEVLGDTMGNVIWDGKKAWRIDNGASFEFRSQGAKKNANDWNEHVTALFSMRDKAIDENTSDAFGALGIFEILKQAEALPLAQNAILQKRIAYTKELAARASDMNADGVSEAWAEKHFEAALKVRALVRDKLRDSLAKTKRKDQGWKDANGRDFDQLRGQGHLGGLIAKELMTRKQRKEIQEWGYGQGSNSWAHDALAAKAFMHGMLPKETSWWNPDQASWLRIDNMKDLCVEKLTPDASAAFHIWHAYTQEILEAINIDNVDRETRRVRLMRTEPQSAGTTRGTAESHSIFRPVGVNHSYLKKLDVPMHRILGTYWQTRKIEEEKGFGGFFSNDHENEFVAHTSGLEIQEEGPLDEESASALF